MVFENGCRESFSNYMILREWRLIFLHSSLDGKDHLTREEHFQTFDCCKQWFNFSQPRFDSSYNNISKRSYAKMCTTQMYLDRHENLPKWHWQPASLLQSCNIKDNPEFTSEDEVFGLLYNFQRPCPCLIFIVSLAKPPLKLWHGWVTTSHAMDVITYPSRNLGETILVNGAPGLLSI